jgi:large subunit ribosomal protein L29
MDAKDIREMTDKEILERIKEEQEMLVKMRFNHSVSAIENPAKIRHTKRTLARLNTILTERKNQNQQGK